MAKATAIHQTSSSPSLHPPYFQMITDAISTLKERTGSSQQAIAKFLEEEYHNVLPPNFKKVLSVQIKKFVKSERLVRVKNSYKISTTEKLKFAIKETQKTKSKKGGNSTTTSRVDAVKMKRLSQVKTPEGFKRVVKKAETANGKMKRLSQVKTPEGLKRKRKSANGEDPRKTTKAEK